MFRVQYWLAVEERGRLESTVTNQARERRWVLLGLIEGLCLRVCGMGVASQQEEVRTIEVHQRLDEKLTIIQLVVAAEQSSPNCLGEDKTLHRPIRPPGPTERLPEQPCATFVT